MVFHFHQFSGFWYVPGVLKLLDFFLDKFHPTWIIPGIHWFVFFLAEKNLTPWAMSLGCLMSETPPKFTKFTASKLEILATLWGLSTWRIIPGRIRGFHWPMGDRWLLSPKDRVVGPLPNGQNVWLINGADSNHLQVLGWSSKHLVGENISFWPFHPQLTGNRFRSTKGFCPKTHGNYLTFTMKNTFFGSSCDMKPAQKAENVTCLEGQGIIYIYIYTYIHVFIYQCIYTTHNMNEVGASDFFIRKKMHFSIEMDHVPWNCSCNDTEPPVS